MANVLLLCRDVTSIATLNFLRSLQLVVQPSLFVKDEIAAESVGVNTTKILKSSLCVLWCHYCKYCWVTSGGIYWNSLLCLKDYNFINLNQCFDYCCIWWTRFPLPVRLFRLLFWEFCIYAFPRCCWCAYDYLRFGLGIGNDFPDGVDSLERGNWAYHVSLKKSKKEEQNLMGITWSETVNETFWWFNSCWRCELLNWTEGTAFGWLPVQTELGKLPFSTFWPSVYELSLREQ